METILKNATIVKLREYSRAYGKPETITSAYLFETDKHITTVDEIGREVRTFRKGTRLLISFSGDTIGGDDFISEVEEAKATKKAQALAQLAANELEVKRSREIAAKQLGAFKAILTPERVNKYRAKLAELNNSKGRNYLMMKAAKHVNGGIFEGLHVSSGDLKRLILTD